MVKMWCAYTIENKINHKKNEKQNQSMRLRTHYEWIFITLLIQEIDKIIDIKFSAHDAYME